MSDILTLAKSDFCSLFMFFPYKEFKANKSWSSIISSNCLACVLSCWLFSPVSKKDFILASPIAIIL